MNEVFSVLLARHRGALRLSQETLAHAAGLSVRALRNLESGRVAVPQRRSLAALADALALDVADRRRFEKAAGTARLDRLTPLPRTVPEQLPPSPPDFTGRRPELSCLVARLTAAAVATGRPRTPGVGSPPDAAALTGPPGVGAMTGPPGVVGMTGPPGLVALTGPPGVGKTALALRAAAEVRHLFPAGRLYVTSAERLRREVPAFGHFLVFLDDVPDPAAAHETLAGLPPCTALVTSRHEGWPGALRLSPLSPADAGALLSRLIGAERVAKEPSAASALLAACGYSPAAIRATATRLARRPSWTIAAFQTAAIPDAAGQAAIGQAAMTPDGTGAVAAGPVTAGQAARESSRAV